MNFIKFNPLDSYGEKATSKINYFLTIKKPRRRERNDYSMLKRR